jgi:hypothetical protein
MDHSPVVHRATVAVTCPGGLTLPAVLLSCRAVEAQLSVAAASRSVRAGGDGGAVEPRCTLNDWQAA